MTSHDETRGAQFALQDMHALEEDRQEVVQRHQEGVGPLAGEVRTEGRVLLGRGDERQDEPLPPLGLALQLRGLPQEELLRLLQVAFLETQPKKRERKEEEILSLCIYYSRNSPMVCWVCVEAAHLNGVDHVVSVQAGPQLVDRRPVDVLQPREEASVQVEPVLLQAGQVVALHQLLQLIDDLIHLHAHCMVNIHLCVCVYIYISG